MSAIKNDWCGGKWEEMCKEQKAVNSVVSYMWISLIKCTRWCANVCFSSVFLRLCVCLIPEHLNLINLPFLFFVSHTESVSVNWGVWVPRTFPDIAVCGAELSGTEEEAGPVVGVALAPRAEPAGGRTPVIRPHHLVYGGTVLISQSCIRGIPVLLRVWRCRKTEKRKERSKERRKY